MMSAAAMGATAFQKGLGAVHALAHPIGAHFDTHHGMTNAVIAPSVLRFNEAVVSTRLGSAAAYMGVGNTISAFLDRVLELRGTLGVPDRLSGLASKMPMSAPSRPTPSMIRPRVAIQSN